MKFKSYKPSELLERVSVIQYAGSGTVTMEMKPMYHERVGSDGGAASPLGVVVEKLALRHLRLALSVYQRHSHLRNHHRPASSTDIRRCS